VRADLGNLCAHILARRFGGKLAGGHVLVARVFSKSYKMLFLKCFKYIKMFFILLN
jgi:hypothetical protein